VESDFMGQHLNALELTLTAPWLIVVGSFARLGQATSDLNRLFTLFFPFRHLLNSGPPFRPELVSEEFVTSQGFSNSVRRIFFDLSPLYPMNKHTRIGADNHGN
jgi:hypothetical protein